MIVDDEYVIIGSANINQRSLAGSRDTEIAVGAYQPDHKGADSPGGKVHAYRMSLWEEHLGKDAVQRPESPGCVRMVNRIARENWRRYAADDGKGPLQGHLMRYPCTSEPTAGWSRCRGTSCSRTYLLDYLTM